MGYKIKIFDGDYLCALEFAVSEWLKENDIDAINISISATTFVGALYYVILVHY